jgi:ParB family chromosome partitioning protein
VKRNVLGRGLGALMDDADKMLPGAGINEIELSKIEANPFQPRTKFDEEPLRELAESIKEIGLIQPITLRKISENKYQIIAGERRFRAAQLAGLEAIPAYIRKAKDEGMLEMALVENIQREDLDAIEIALSYQRLLEELEFTQEELSTRIGKKRSTIANYLRLLKLPAIIQKGLIDKQISMGHARAIINIENPDKQTLIYNQIIKMGLSVRRVEEIVRNIGNEAQNEPAETEKQKFPKEYKPIKKQLDKIFSSKVDFSMNSNGKGKIVIPFNSPADLDRIVKIIENQKL